MLLNLLHGQVTLNGEVTTYTPNENYSGSDSFTFKANDGTDDSSIATVSITVNPINDPPVVQFTAIPTTGTAPLTVQFDASASFDIDGAIVSYDWGFGDTTSGSGVASTHEYTQEGRYTVTLTVTDDENASNTAFTTINAEPPVSGENIISNPGFEEGTDSWQFYSNGSGSFSSTSPGYEGANAAEISIAQAGSNVQLYQSGLDLEPNTDYRLSFVAYSNTGRDLEVYIHKHGSPYTNYGLSDWVADLTSSWQTFSVDFTSNSSASSDARLRFWLAPHATSGDVYWIDQVELMEF